jgi:hypothetical protein
MSGARAAMRHCKMTGIENTIESQLDCGLIVARFKNDKYLSAALMAG